MTRILRKQAARRVVQKAVWSAAEEAAAIRARAEERGLSEGHRKGHTEGLREVLEALGPSVDAEQRSQRLVPIVIEAAEALLGEALKADPNRVTSIVRRTLDRVRRASALRIEVHPEDVPWVEALATERGASVVPDASLARGDCFVRSNVGSVDGRLRTRLKILRDALERNSHPDPSAW